MKLKERSLYDLTLPELTDWVISSGESAYRAKQIFGALYKRGAGPDKMLELPKSLREKIAHSFPSAPVEKADLQKSADGTMKLLSKLPDGKFVETVLIPAKERNTVCVSTQVGCAYACGFCASGQLGFDRNLSAGEIVQQVLMLEKAAGDTGAASRPPAGGDHPSRAETPMPGARLSRGRTREVSNIVFMGMGEPMANYDNLLKAIRILNDPEGLQIGARKITISTVGLVPMILKLAGEGLQVELAISLHASNDVVRKQLMPVNAKYPLSQLIPAVKNYIAATNRLVTFEYILIDQVNDDLDHARELADLLEGMQVKVNLIPFHPVPNTPWKQPARGRMLAFERILRERRIRCSLRRSRGLDIDGACGQLRLRKVQEA